VADRDLHTILSFDAGSASGFATDPFGEEPLPFGCQMGTVSEPVVRIEEQDGFVHVSDGRPDSEGFALPGIFQPNLDGDDVCIPVAGSELCFRDIDTSDESSLPLIAEGYDPFSAVLDPSEDEDKLSTILSGAPSASMPDSLSQSFADYYFMKGAVGDVIDGRRTLTLEEEAYLRMHAAAILEEMSMDTDSTLFSHESYSDYAANIYSADNPFDIDVPIFAGSDYTLTFNPSSGTEIVDCAYDGPGKIAPYEYLSEITLDDALKIELLHAKEKVMEEMEALDRTSYYDHSEEIEDLASIEDADELAHAIEAMIPKVSRGQKLKDLRDIAWNVGGSATIGDEKIDLHFEIYELSLVEDEEQFALGALEVLDKVKVVSLANGLDALVEMGDEMIAHVDEILVGIPRDDDAYSHCSQAMHGRSGCNIGVQLLAGTENSAEYERYFKRLKETAIAIRDTLDGGDYDKAIAEYTSLVNQDRFQNVISHLEGDLEMTQTFKFGAKIGIVVAAMAIANVVGVYAGAGIAALGAPAWAVGGGELAAGSLAFVSANRGLNTLLLGEDFFDPNLSPGGNALQFMEEWAMTALMFKFLRLGMNSYNNVVRSVLMRRAGSALIREGVITEAELAGMGAETMQKVALRAELGLMGRVLNHGGLFATEYVAFTAWDYLRMTYEASKEAGALALPEDFFTSESLAERFVFLACLKVGGALASPFTAPLQAKVSSSLMKRYAPKLRQYDAEYSRLRERLESYDGEDPVELDAIFKDMVGLLKKRQALETAMSRVDPDMVKSSAQTKAVLDNVKSMQDEAVLLEVLCSGSYGEIGKSRTIRLLKLGRKQGLLDYRINKSGEIVVKLDEGTEIRLIKEKPLETPKEGIEAEDAAESIPASATEAVAEEVPVEAEVIEGESKVDKPITNWRHTYKQAWSFGVPVLTGKSIIVYRAPKFTGTEPKLEPAEQAMFESLISKIKGKFSRKTKLAARAIMLRDTFFASPKESRAKIMKGIKFLKALADEADSMQARHALMKGLNKAIEKNAVSVMEIPLELDARIGPSHPRYEIGGQWYHYTDQAGFNRIMASGALKPSAAVDGRSSRLWVTDRSFSNSEVQDKIYQCGTIRGMVDANKGEYVIAFTVFEGAKTVFNPGKNPIEFWTNKALEFGADILINYAGQNPRTPFMKEASH